MKISVIAVLNRQEPLRESAILAQRNSQASIPPEAKAPKGLTIDRTIAAVPLGSANPGDMSLDSVQPENSEKFAVRAFIDVDSADNVPAESDGQALFADPKISSFLTCGGTPPVGNARNVAQMLRTPVLHGNGLDGENVAIAILDTGINLAYLAQKLGGMPRFDAANSWTVPGGTTAPGHHPVNHGTMCAYDALIAAPKATLLDFPILSNRAPGGSSMGGTLSVALVAFAQLLASRSVAFGPGGLGRYKALVLNNSWGMYHPSWDFPAGHPGRYCDNPNHPFNLQLNTLARSNIDIIFAAGNCGAQCADGRCNTRVTETIMGANAHADVLTLAGCDTSDARVGYSSQGPSIAGMFREKPDITAYTHFSGSEAFGVGSADSGTSTACPVAAGCVAALRTKVLPAGMPPANLFAQLKTTARKVAGATGWNKDYGHGIIDPVSTGQSLGVIPPGVA